VRGVRGAAITQLSQLVGQHREPKALVKGRGDQKGRLIDNPEITEHVQRSSAQWVNQRDKVLVMSPDYRRALEENARLAEGAGLHLPSQWLE
jgi:hypothetical protein